MSPGSVRRSLLALLAAAAVLLAAPSGRSAAGRPASGRPASGRPSAGRPASTPAETRNEHSFRRISRNEHSFRRVRRAVRRPGRGLSTVLQLRPGKVVRRLPRQLPSGAGRLERRVLDGRELLVYLPPGYRAGDRRRYPVLILQDGQNLFGEGSGSWQVHRAIDAEVQAGRAEPVIVIGVSAQPSHEGRVAEYAVRRDEGEQLGGGGAAYIEFVADRLVPWLRRELPVRNGARHVAIGGSSMGARIALEAALARPDVFGKVMALSPSVWFDDAEILRRVEGGESLPASAEIYLDSGGSGRSRDDADNVFRLRDALMARSFQHGSWDAPRQRAPRRLWHWFQADHQHDETAWRERFPRALRVMFPAD
jgi:predicted alpha/beta superfamily hydrolase